MKKDNLLVSDNIKFMNYSKHGNIDKYIAQYIGEKWLDYRKKWRNAVELKEFYNFPLYITIEQHFKCNYKCIMCYHSDKEQYELLNHKSKLSHDDVKKIIDEASKIGTLSICLNAGNEPLLDRDIYKLVKYTKSKGILDVFITTNGSLLDENVAEKLIDAGLTQIRVSIDAFSEEVYKKVRRSNNFSLVKDNVKRLIKIRNKKGRILPIVRVSFVHMSINSHEFEDFKNYWKDIVDYVSIQRYTPVNLKPNMLTLIPKERDSYKNTICSMPFSMIYIRANGDVFPCGRIEYGIKIGNIFKNSIYEIWNSKKSNELRKKLLNLRYSEIEGCKKCFESASLI